MLFRSAVGGDNLSIADLTEVVEFAVAAGHDAIEITLAMASQAVRKAKATKDRRAEWKAEQNEGGPV